MAEKILVLGVDRDNDIGEKTGIKGPILGKEFLLETALKLGVVDPTESDTNVLFQCVKIYETLKEEGKDAYVACITGDKSVGIKSDIEIIKQFDVIKETFNIDSVILVSDGKEDENVLPILQSKVNIISIDRLTVQQSESLEDTYFILHRYIKQMMDDKKVSGLFLGLPGIIIIIYALTYLFPDQTKYGWFAIFSIVGSYLFAKGFGVDDYLKDRMTPRKVKIIAYSVAIVIAAYGGYNGFMNIRWEMVPYLNWESAKYVFTVFFDGSFPLLYMGIIAALAGNVISAYTNKAKHIWNSLIIFILACAVFGNFYQYTAYTQNEITRNEAVFSAIVLAFFAIIGIGVAFIQKSKLSSTSKIKRTVSLSRKGIITLFIGGFIITSMVLYSIENTNEVTDTETSFHITKNLADQFNPVMGINSDGLVYCVWQDNRDGNWNIYLKYFDSGNEISIAKDTNDQKNPRVWGDKIVWQDNRNGAWDIYLYDMSTNALTQVTDNEFNQSNPDIYENRIVWEDERNENSDIYFYNIINKDEKRITIDDPALQPFQTTPRIYGNTIVWLDNRFGEFNIFSYNVGTGIEHAVTSGRSIKFNPSIYNNVIVWEDNRNGNWDIYLYDMSTKEELQITKDPSNQVNPVIYENYVIWEDDRNGNKDIYIFNRETSATLQVTDAISDQENPFACDSYVCWVDWRNDLDGIHTGIAEDNPDIYGIDIENIWAK
ncbi:MAG: DUF373 family protein [Candidatus Methanofastidiosia archaeon]